MKIINTEPLHKYSVIVCLERKCLYSHECANHITAGDFRTEDGVKPNLVLNNGHVTCKTIDSKPRHDSYPDLFPTIDCGYGAVEVKELIEETNDFQI